jgi:hypothetical protein
MQGYVAAVEHDTVAVDLDTQQLSPNAALNISRAFQASPKSESCCVCASGPDRLVVRGVLRRRVEQLDSR